MPLALRWTQRSIPVEKYEQLPIIFCTLAQWNALIFCRNPLDNHIICNPYNNLLSTNDWYNLYTDLMRKLKPSLDEAGIEIPYPHRVINTPVKK